jgi:hypothetical protein
MESATRHVRRVGLAPPGPTRLRRLTFGLTLDNCARAAGLTLTAASFAERGIGKTVPEDLRRLDAAIERLAGGAS